MGWLYCFIIYRVCGRVRKNLEISSCAHCSTQYMQIMPENSTGKMMESIGVITYFTTIKALPKKKW